MDAPFSPLFDISRRIAVSFLHMSLGLILFWIGSLKFVDPSPVVGLLAGSLSFLAFPAFVYLLGIVEVSAALLLWSNRGVRYAALVSVGLFAGTLIILVVAPAITYGEAGFPLLSRVGQFLLKDLVLMAASVSLVAMDSAKQPQMIAAVEPAYQA